MSAISKAGKMLEIIIDRTDIKEKLEEAQESGNEIEEKRYKEELDKINKAANDLAPQIG